MMRDRPSYNVWSYKPWWCQPWSIALTAISVTVGSWLLFHRYWVTGMVAVPMLSWMGFFLLVWPRLMGEALQEAASRSDVDQSNQPSNS